MSTGSEGAHARFHLEFSSVLKRSKSLKAKRSKLSEAWKRSKSKLSELSMETLKI